LGSNVEHLDLEDTQGISGLKAIRVDVNLNPEIPAESKQSVVKRETSNVNDVQAAGVEKLTG
jgi:hypothetical protein